MSRTLVTVTCPECRGTGGRSDAYRFASCDLCRGRKTIEAEVAVEPSRVELLAERVARAALEELRGIRLALEAANRPQRRSLYRPARR